MILLSKVIKSQFTRKESAQKRVISLKPLSLQTDTHLEPIDEKNEEEHSIDLKEIEFKANEILENANQQAEAIKKEAENFYQDVLQQIDQEKQSWNEEKQYLIRQAEKEGFEKGFYEGKQQGFHEYKQLIEDAKKIIDLSQSDYQKHIENAEFTILQLGVKTAEKILAMTLDQDHEYFMNIVQKVIREVRDHSDIKLHVHPKYFELVIARKDELQALFHNPTSELYIFPDDEIEPDSCIVESSFGRIDASIDSQLIEIKKKLLELLEEDKLHEGSEHHIKN